MNTRTAIMDASSAIILYKAGLHTLLADTFSIVMPDSVYEEITGNPYAGSGEYAELLAEGRIRIVEMTGQQERHELSGLDKGERDAITLFYDGAGDFILVDDGPAARYCTREGIPFINALLFPKVVRFAGIRDDDFCRSAMERIIASARYSKGIIDFAGTCRKREIAFAIPET